MNICLNFAQISKKLIFFDVRPSKHGVSESFCMKSVQMSEKICCDETHYDNATDMNTYRNFAQIPEKLILLDVCPLKHGFSELFCTESVQMNETRVERKHITTHPYAATTAVSRVKTNVHSLYFVSLSLNKSTKKSIVLLAACDRLILNSGSVCASGVRLSFFRLLYEDSTDLNKHNAKPRSHT